MRRIKMKANAMEDADVGFVSLVSLPASRIPFRVTKSEDDPQEGKMINLNRLFKRDGDQAKLEGVTLAGVILQKQHVEHFSPQLQELGVKTDDVTEQDDCIIMKQCDYEDDEVTLVKLGELAGVFLNVPDEVKKGFDPFMESEDFGENLNMQFLPGVHAATDALMTSVVHVLRNAEDSQSARDRISSNIDAYKQAVMTLAGSLPEVAFKMEVLELPAEESSDATDQDGDGPDSGSESSEADDNESVSKDGDGEESGDGEDAGEKETQKADAKDDGLTDEERETLKGVHLEGAEDEGKRESEASADEDEGDGDDVKKSDDPDEGLAALLTSFKSEVLAAVKSVQTEVSDLKKSQGDLADKVKDAQEAAEKATKAIKGTVPSSSDAGDDVRDESLGTRRSKAGKAEEEFWGGTALDRIAGHVESA